MKRLLILSIVCVVFAYTSCKKDSSSTNNNNNDTTANNHNNSSNNTNNNDTTPTVPTIPGTITVAINGIPDSFNTNATAAWLSGFALLGSAYGIHVRGDNKSGVDSTNLNFDIFDATPISAGHYNTGFFFYVENADSTSSQPAGGPDTIGITITFIDSTITHRIKGTFSGVGINYPTMGSSKPLTTDTFTNGKFDVPISNVPLSF